MEDWSDTDSGNEQPNSEVRIPTGERDQSKPSFREPVPGPDEPKDDKILLKETRKKKKEIERLEDLLEKKREEEEYLQGLLKEQVKRDQLHGETTIGKGEVENQRKTLALLIHDLMKEIKLKREDLDDELGRYSDEHDKPKKLSTDPSSYPAHRRSRESAFVIQGGYDIDATGIPKPPDERIHAKWAQTVGSDTQTIGNVGGVQDWKQAGREQNLSGQSQEAKGQLSDAGQGMYDRVTGHVGAAGSAIMSDKERESRYHLDPLFHDLDFRFESPPPSSVPRLRPPPSLPPLRPPDPFFDDHRTSTRRHLDDSRRSEDKIEPHGHNFHKIFAAQNHAESPRSLITCNISLTNDVAKFIDSELDEDDSIWDLVVLTGFGDEDGHGGRLLATTCGQFMAAKWPRSCDKFKKMLSFVFEKGERKEKSLVLEKDDKSSYTAVNRLLERRNSMRLRGTVEDLIDFIQALTWMSAILVTGDKGPVASGSILECNGEIKGEYKIQNDLCEPLLRDRVEESACWVPLFPRTASAIDLPGPRRPRDMLGLEISFELMCFMCGLTYETFEGGGVILYGQHSIVYPVRYSKSASCIQWHFQERSKYHTDEIKGTRILDDDLDRLCQASRHFLGLWEEPDIMLGTGKQSFKMKWSATEEVRQTTTRDGFNIGGSFVVPKVLTLNWTQTYKVAKNRRTQFIRNFLIDLQRRINSSVLLYSPSEKCGWVVSYVSVLLHLARCRAHEQRVLGLNIPPCETSSNGGQAAFECIRACYRRPIKQAEENEVLSDDEKNYTVEEYLKEIMVTMDLIRRESSRARGFFRTQILGYELADIAHMKDTMRMKRYALPHFCTGWAPILDEIEWAFFYEGMPCPIKSKNANGRTFSSSCEMGTWKEIPRGFDLLTVSLPCLTNLSEHLNQGRLDRLTSEYRWHTPGVRDVFKYCAKKRRHVCDRLQEFKADDRGLDIRSPNISLELARTTGAVVFKYVHDLERILSETAAERSRASLEPSVSPHGSSSATFHFSTRGTSVDTDPTSVEDENASDDTVEIQETMRDIDLRPDNNDLAVIAGPRREEREHSSVPARSLRHAAGSHEGHREEGSRHRRKATSKHSTHDNSSSKRSGQRSSRNSGKGTSLIDRLLG